jgi:hypothetical protein
MLSEWQRNPPIVARCSDIARPKRRSIERLLSAWLNQPPKPAEATAVSKAKAQIAVVRPLIRGLKIVDWDPFDPFLRCGLVPLERHTRDFEAGLLEDPSTLRILLNLCAKEN